MYPDTAAAYTSSTLQGDPLSEAVERLFEPLACLCLSNGMLFAKAEELLKQSFINAARKLQPDLPQHGMVSRIAASTGLNRREVTRLVHDKAPRRSVKIPLAAEVIARWSAEPLYRSADGQPLVLKRQGDAPSFEALARSITRDMHPRSILEELLRLGVVQHDQGADQISLLRSDYIPGTDQGELLAFLGTNVGDHLESAVANVLQNDIQHHDQAIFADELSEESVKTLAPLIMAHWHRLRDDLVPAITACIEADHQAGRPQDQRVRVGLYSFSQTEANEEPADER
jgi:hypothetical protein